MKTHICCALAAGMLCGSGAIVSAAAPGKPVSDRELMKLAIHTPRPEYPYQARRKKITGSGVVFGKVNAAGVVTSVTMRQSTGSAILDGAAISAFSRWRFKPGRAFSFACPITFTMTGMRY